VSALRTEVEGYDLRAQQFEVEAARAEATRYDAEVNVWRTADDALRAEAELSAAQSRASAQAEQAALFQRAQYTYAPAASRKRS
jgi:hypothetical protein